MILVTIGGHLPFTIVRRRGAGTSAWLRSALRCISCAAHVALPSGVLMSVKAKGQAWAAARRKQAYEALYPETRHGAIGNGREKIGHFGHSTFAADTAAKTGQASARCVWMPLEAPV